MSRPVLAVIAVAAACSKPGPAPSAPSSSPSASSSAASSAGPRPAAPPPGGAELSPALAPLAGWLGDWDSSDGKASEHWVAAAGAIYGVVLRGEIFEVLVIDDGDGPGRPDGVLRLYAMPHGARSIEYRPRSVVAGAATFATDEPEFPKTLRYELAADRSSLTAVLDGSRRIEIQFRRGARSPAPELEAADLAFAAATAQRGAAGWVAAFDPHGGMMRKAGRIEYDAIAEAMAPTLSSGRLDWAPIASGKAGELGFTVGKATFTGARPEDGWRSSYVTIWHHQPDGSWKVLFDTGRLVQEP